MSESQRKKRQKVRQPPEDVFIERIGEVIRRFSANHPDVTFEHELQSKYNALCIWVYAPENYTDQDILELGNALLEAASAGAEALALTYAWSIGIYRESDKSEPIRIIESRSQPERFCIACGYRQEIQHGNNCLQCQSPLSS